MLTIMPTNNKTDWIICYEMAKTLLYKRNKRFFFNKICFIRHIPPMIQNWITLIQTQFNGGEASEALLSLKDKTPEEQERIRAGLLEYCKLDTYAMVKIWEKFIEVTND